MWYNKRPGGGDDDDGESISTLSDIVSAVPQSPGGHSQRNTAGSTSISQLCLESQSSRPRCAAMGVTATTNSSREIHSRRPAAAAAAAVIVMLMMSAASAEVGVAASRAAAAVGSLRSSSYLVPQLLESPTVELTSCAAELSPASI